MIGENGKTRSTSSPGDFPASRTVLPAEDLERMTLDISGPKCLGQFAPYNRDGSWAKMFAALLAGMEGWSSTRCRLTWKMRDTRCSRFFCQLQASAHRTGASASGLLPTPTGMEDRTKNITEKNYHKKKGNLATAAIMGLLPTPTTGSNRNSRNAVQRIGTTHQHHGLALGLAQVAEIYMGTLPKEFDSWKQVPGHYKGFLPTPTAVTDVKGGCTRSDPKRQNGSLANAIHGIMGTRGGTSQLSPRFVMEMMGFPSLWTVLPFLGGAQKV